MKASAKADGYFLQLLVNVLSVPLNLKQAVLLSVALTIMYYRQVFASPAPYLLLAAALALRWFAKAVNLDSNYQVILHQPVSCSHALSPTVTPAKALRLATHVIQVILLQPILLFVPYQLVLSATAFSAWRHHLALRVELAINYLKAQTNVS